MYFNIFNMIEGDLPKRYAKKNLMNETDLLITLMHNINIIMNSVRVEGLPDTCNERFLKLCYILRGSVCMYNSPEFGLINPMAAIGGELNMYGEPSKVTLSVYGSDTETLKLSGRTVRVYMDGSDNTDAEAVWERANPLMLPPVFLIMKYSADMSDTLMSIRTAAKTLKIPWILTCPPELRAELIDVINDINENALAVLSVNMDKVNRIELFNTNNNPDVLKGLWEHYKNLQNELRSLFGIQSQENTDKRERLNVPEVKRNDEFTKLNEYDFKGGLLNFCKKCNEIFGLSMSVQRTIKEENNDSKRDDNTEAERDNQ